MWSETLLPVMKLLTGLRTTARLAELIPGTNVHTGLIIGVLVVVFGYLLLYKSTFGLQIRTIGANAAFARYSGMPVAKVIVLSQLLGGFIAGLGGTTEVLGLYNRFGYYRPDQSWLGME